MIVLDTSGLLAALFPDQRRHRACARVIERDGGPFLLSPFVLAELDHLVGRLAGVRAELELLEQVEAGAYRLETFDPRALTRAREVIATYRDQGIGLADASLVVLAERYGTRRLLTLDERHFRVVESADGPFELLPTDG